jgi:LAO/AO transport system kinase
VAKAGILEIADVFVVNKADREGADVAVRDLEQMIHAGAELPWTPPVRKTVAAEGGGVEELWDAISSHRTYLEETGALLANRRNRLMREVETLAAEAIRGRAREALSEDLALADDLLERRIDPYRAAAAVIERLGAPG